jgi:hypothetical protein
MRAHPPATKLATFLAILTTATATAAQTPLSGPITSAEAAMRYHLSLQYHMPRLRMWTAQDNPPCAAIGPQAPGGSADARLNRIVRSHTREMLDRGAWVNPWMPPDPHSAGGR